MGALWFSGLRFLESISEIVGYKSGLAFGRDELNDFFKSEDSFESYADIEDDAPLRIRSEVFEEVIEGLLFKVGRLEKRNNLLPGISTFHKYKSNPKLFPISQAISQEYIKWMKAEIPKAAQRTNKTMDPSGFLTIAAGKYGKVGLQMAADLIEEMIAYQVRSPWNVPEELQWHDLLELKALFESEKLNAFYGEFFDQRYIDYLHRNEADLDKIHWRKFEELTAEYLDRSGYSVQLGPGRGDDGVDVRAWRLKGDQGPPQVIVQCKRQKSKIEKVVIKALYADVVAEKADSGMIVTTSRLSKGAEATRRARHYPVQVADRATLREWLSKLRAPGAGIVM